MQAGSRKPKRPCAKSEERFSLFMKHMPGVAFIKDPGGEYVYANDALASLVNQQLEDILGATDQDLFPPEIALLLSENDAQVRSHGRPSTVEESGIMDGVERHYVTVKFPYPMPDAGGWGVAGVGLDISSHRLMS